MTQMQYRCVWNEINSRSLICSCCRRRSAQKNAKWPNRLMLVKISGHIVILCVVRKQNVTVYYYVYRSVMEQTVLFVWWRQVAKQVLAYHQPRLGSNAQLWCSVYAWQMGVSLGKQFRIPLTSHGSSAINFSSLITCMSYVHVCRTLLQYATWDLAFHMIPMSEIDMNFAKSQLLLFLSNRYMNPKGQVL